MAAHVTYGDVQEYLNALQPYITYFKNINVLKRLTKAELQTVVEMGNIQDTMYNTQYGQPAVTKTQFDKTHTDDLLEICFYFFGRKKVMEGMSGIDVENTILSNMHDAWAIARLIEFDPVTSKSTDYKDPNAFMDVSKMNSEDEAKVRRPVVGLTSVPGVNSIIRVDQLSMFIEFDKLYDVNKAEAQKDITPRLAIEKLLETKRDICESIAKKVMGPFGSTPTIGARFKTFIGIGGKNNSKPSKAEWIKTSRTVKITQGKGKNTKTTEKTIYKNAQTGELRVRKMVTRKGVRKATYVKF